MTIDHRLAVYGTLAPGERNHRQVAELRGEWRAGTVRGRLVIKSRGAAMGYPALTLAEDGEEIAVQVLVSADLPAHWRRLDRFEGPGYRRAPVPVETPDGTIEAWIYLDAAPDG